MGYLEGLAETYDITLLSFEKVNHSREALSQQMPAAGIDWHPMTYHGRPPLISTLLDIFNGTRLIRRLCRGGLRPDVVHVRSYVPGCIALLSTQCALVFDIRGFWADERVEGGLWPRGGLVDRMVRAVERTLYRRASAVVTLTHASVPHIRVMTKGAVPIRAIRTCADTKRFANTRRVDGKPRVVWVGSIGPWYRFDLAVRLAAAMNASMHVFTRETAMAIVDMDGVAGEVKEVSPDALDAELREGDIGTAFYRQCFLP